MNPLEQLRDIHAAPTVPWWPPAPGWWLLAVLIILAGVWLMRRLLRWWRRLRQRRAVQQWFALIWTGYEAHQDRRRLAMALDTGLRRLALLRYPPKFEAGVVGGTQNVAALVGDEWLRWWLRGHEPDTLSRALLTAPYQQQPDYDAAALYQYVLHWVRDHA